MFEEKEKLYTEAAIAYNRGEPIMTDSEFDLLEKELAEAGSDVVNKTHDELAGATIDSDTFSIRPIHEKSEIMSWINYQPVDEFFASLKIDGVLARVQSGANFKAESRGRDDNIPWDYSTALQQILPKIPEQYFIRGECFVPETHLEYFRDKYDKDKYKVARSAAITVLRRPQDHGADDVQKLKFLAYYIEGDYGTKSDMFEHLKRLGFEVPPHKIVTFKNGGEDFDELQAGMETAVYPSDGVVIEYNDLKILPDGSSGDKYLSTQIAAKVGRWGMSHFKSKVLGVNLTPGKGHFGTVLEVEPVVMPDGITQKNINVFNIGAIIKNRIGVGTEIVFERQSNGMCYFKGVAK